MKAKRNSRGFTLVEILTVVIIIGILMTLTSAAVYKAVVSAKEWATFNEEVQMQNCMVAFMQARGVAVYPPCDLRMSAANDYNAPVYKYFRRIYPRYDANNRLYNELQNYGVNTATFDPGHALVFWLVGFNPDEENPLLNHDKRMSGADVTQRLYPFDQNRLINKHYLAYNTPGTAWYDDSIAPIGSYTYGEKFRAYIYFDNNGQTYTYAVPSVGALDNFTPYKTGTTATDYYYNRDTCQIITAGKDTKLGKGGAPVAAGEPYTNEDADNIANFGEGRNMRDFIERRR